MQTSKTLYIFIVLLAVFLGIASIFLFTSPGSIDARNFEMIFRDVMYKGASFIPDCLNYLCPSNVILTKFPPGHALTFYLFSLVFPVRIFGAFIAMKSLILFFYLVSLGTFLYFSKRVGNLNWGIARQIALYLSLSSLVLNTQGLAYTDVLNFPFLIISIMFLLQKKYIGSGLFFGLSCLMKWQPVIMLPVILVYLVFNDEKNRTKTSTVKFLGGLVLSVFFLFLFTPQIGSGLLLSLRNAVTHTANYALNPQWVIQNLPIAHVAVPVYGSPSMLWAGIQLGVFAISYALVCWNLFRHKLKGQHEEYFLHSLLLALGVYYLFSFGVHENHFILGSIIALLLFVYRPTRSNYILLFVVDMLNSINMFVFYGFSGVSLFPTHAQGIDATVILAAIISLGSVAYLLRIFLSKKFI